MTTADALLDKRPRADSEVKRDRYKRYLIPDPVSGDEVAWTRVSTIAGTLDDTYGLQKHDQRLVAYGVGHNRDLYAKAAAAKLDDKSDLGKIAWEAMSRSKSSEKANLGTAVHRFAERVEGHEIGLDDVPEEWRRDVTAYVECLRLNDIVSLSEWTERIVIIPELQAAGTVDRAWQHLSAWPHVRIGDLKTGSVEYGWFKFAIQEALYSRATHWFDPKTGELHEIAETIDQNLAMVAHVPVGVGACRLWAVDIAFGWDFAVKAWETREGRKRKDIAEPFGVAVGFDDEKPALDEETGAAEPVEASDERMRWLRARIAAIYGEGYGPELERRWLVAEVPVPSAGGHTDEQVSLASAWCAEVEDAHEMPWGEVDPLIAAAFPKAEYVDPNTLEPPERHEPRADAKHWAGKAKALLDGFTSSEVKAIAACAGLTPADSLMSEQRYDLVEAIVGELEQGAVVFEYSSEGAYVAPAHNAAFLMEAACAGPDGKLGKSAALMRAKALAKDLGLPAPRSLAKAAESPLLAALVAAGRGNTTTSESESQ